MKHAHIMNAIGNTPLVKVQFEDNIPLYAKLEYLNPGGSVKDRSAIFMIEEAEKKGLLTPGGTIIDASSGNQGIAVAMIGAAKGYKVIITVTEKISKEKLNTLKAYGAHIVMCPSVSTIDDPRSYHSVALEIQKNTPNSFMPNQYFNESNRLAHQTLLGPEIWEQTDGAVTHFFAAAGTGGTISGVGRYLKSKNPSIKIIAADSNNSFRSTKGNPKPYAIEGMGIDFVSPVVDYTVIDEIIEVDDEPALNMLKPLARQHGLLVGLSSGAVAYTAQQYMRHMKKDDLGVMIFGDSGRAYLSKGFYSEESDQVIPCQTVLEKGAQLEW
jgi:cystathionine beta-synthase